MASKPLESPHCAFIIDNQSGTPMTIHPKLKRTGEIHDTLTGYDFRVDDKLSPMKAIRVKCVECQGGGTKQVRNCEISDCTLWPYRSGKTGRKRATSSHGLEKTPQIKELSNA